MSKLKTKYLIPHIKKEPHALNFLLFVEIIICNMK